jgi:hypothetical protein
MPSPIPSQTAPISNQNVARLFAPKYGVHNRARPDMKNLSQIQKEHEERGPDN